MKLKTGKFSTIADSVSARDLVNLALCAIATVALALAGWALWAMIT